MIRVLAPGLYTTVQDLGRPGWRASGVPVSGAADPLALRVANLLVGNPEGAAALELTLKGPMLEFEAASVGVLCGAPFEARLDGEAMEPYRPYAIPKGAVLEVRHTPKGCRGVLAVAGGIAVPAVLGSRSTYVRARLGGVAGGPLVAGDRLPLGPLSPEAQRLLARLRTAGRAGYKAAPALAAAYIPDTAQAGAAAVVRAQRGPEAALFASAAVESFWSEPYTVRPEADRMGLRLSGSAPLELPTSAASILSEAAAPGAVQVPPDGQPIVLLPDCGVTGGYPRLAHTAAVDLPLLGQLRPGMVLRFREIHPSEAERLVLQRELELARLQAAMWSWLRQT